jgi:DNA replication protein DnaC
VGKTHLLVGLGIRAVEQGFSVQYFRFDELMTALKEDARTRLRSDDPPGSQPVLPPRILPLRPWRHHDHHQQERARLDRTPRRGDEVLTTAILDRLLHRSHVKGRSYRLRDLEEALKLSRS